MQWKAARWALAATLLFGAAIAGATTSYNFTIDAGASSVDAKVAFMGIGNRKALFPAVRGTVALTPDAMDRINLDVMIDATQLRADDSLTTNRLKGDAFFNVAKYPTVRFQGTDLSMATQTSGIVRGNLTARGVTRPVTLNVSFSAPPSTTSLKEPIRLTGVTTINRKDFGMTAYSLIVGKKVTISIRTKLVPA
ncbi:MAG: YceI family protein [Sphingomonadales bacterium]|jgi:polyisoprenoid-binding protein YceI|nr:YceI family protein [Sphingomonadales bacterium]